MSVLLIILFAVVVFVFLLFIILTYTGKRRIIDRMPSYEPTLPIIGHYQFLTAKSLYEAWSLFNFMAKETGSPMVNRLLAGRKVAAFKAKDLEELLRSSENITKSKDYDMVRPWLGDGLLTSTSTKWFHRRKQLTSSFHFGILQNFVPIMNEQAKILVELMKIKSTKASGRPFDICPFMTHATLDIICETAMGTKLESQTKTSEYVQALSEFGETVVHRIIRPWLWYEPISLLFPIGRKHKRLIKIMHQFTNGVIKERIAQRQQLKSSVQSEDDVFSKRKRLAFLESLLEMYDAGQMSLEDVRAEVDTFMFEGHDTTSSGMMWSLYCLAKYPDFQQKLYEEIEDELDSSDDISSEDVGRLRYMELFLKESHRMFPPVPQVGRLITKEFTIGGYTIPKGTLIDIAIFQAHRDPEQFPEPDRFDPDRFLPENATKRNPFAYIPFSAGPRNCIGQKFASLESKILLTHLVRNFKFSTTQSVEETMGTALMILRPMGGIWLTVETRKK